MNKLIYLVRHCSAEGQGAECPLTTLGRQQARRLADLFSKKKIDHVITSPYKRALQSIEPLAERKSLKINIDNRLVERKLSNQDLPDWLEKLEASFNNMYVYYSGGESSREAMNRGMGVINDILKNLINQPLWLLTET